MAFTGSKAVAIDQLMNKLKKLAYFYD